MTSNHSSARTVPEAAAAAPRMDLDVRPVLAGGGEPLGLILETLARVPPGHVFQLRAPFEPVPLFVVLRLRGWAYWIESGAGEDWTVCFYRSADFKST